VKLVDVSELIRDVESLIAPQAAAKSLALRYESCPAGILAWADAEKIRQVLVNLLSNAIKFTPDGGEVHVECDAGARFAVVRVRDSGIGIPAANLADIFDPFVRVEQNRAGSTEGVGLGLAISKEIVCALGGEIWAESVEGQGTTISFSLPRERRTPM